MPRKNRSPDREMDLEVLRAAAVRRIVRRSPANGWLQFPAVPSLVDHYVNVLQTIFEGLGRGFGDEELANARLILSERIADCYKASQYGHIVVTYQTDPAPATSLTYNVESVILSMGDQYADWIANRTPPLFGNNPDAKVMAVAATLGKSRRVPDFSTSARGWGEHTLALGAARFSRSTSLEMTGPFCVRLREAASSENLLHKRHRKRTSLDPSTRLDRRYRLIFLSGRSPQHFSDCIKTSGCFSSGRTKVYFPGGHLLFNVFVPIDAYAPSADLDRELSESGLGVDVHPKRDKRRPQRSLDSSPSPTSPSSLSSAQEHRRRRLAPHWLVCRMGRWPGSFRLAHRLLSQLTCIGSSIVARSRERERAGPGLLTSRRG